MLEFSNYDDNSIVTPVNVDNLKSLLIESKFDKKKTDILVDGFTHGFNIGYDGPKNRQTFSRNHKLRFGNELKLWNKVMKEVKEKRLVGLLKAIKFDNFVQSPLGKTTLRVF